MCVCVRAHVRVCGVVCLGMCVHKSQRPDCDHPRPPRPPPPPPDSLERIYATAHFGVTTRIT